MASLTPDKFVIGAKLHTTPHLGLYRDPTLEYRPSQRHTEVFTEGYQSIENVNLDVALFAVPDRTPINDLCPHEHIPGETLVNVFGQMPGLYDEEWAAWKVLPQYDTKVFHVHHGEVVDGECGVAPFDVSSCKNESYMHQYSVDRYRLFCAAGMPPTQDMHFKVQHPVNLKWGFGDSRSDTEHLPEWSFDFQSKFYFTFDNKVLDEEKKYMGSGGNFVEGHIRRWAAEPYFKGLAACDPHILSDCGYDVPANPPVLQPHLIINADVDRTWDTLSKIPQNGFGGGAKNWPSTKEELRTLLEDGDASCDPACPSFPMEINLEATLRAFTGVQDGTIALKPQSRILISVNLGIFPLYYQPDKSGLTTSRIKKWFLQVQSVTATDLSADYTQRSTSTVRVQVSFDSGAKAFFQTYDMGATDFYNMIGAWTGLVSLGLIVLAKWQEKVQPFGFINAWDCDDYNHAACDAGNLDEVNGYRERVGLPPIVQEEEAAPVDPAPGAAPAPIAGPAASPEQPEILVPQQIPVGAQG